MLVTARALFLPCVRGVALQAFDHNHDGEIGYAELYGGITWLGLKLTPKQVHIAYIALSIY